MLPPSSYFLGQVYVACVYGLTVMLIDDECKEISDETRKVG